MKVDLKSIAALMLYKNPNAYKVLNSLHPSEIIQGDVLNSDKEVILSLPEEYKNKSIAFLLKRSKEIHTALVSFEQVIKREQFGRILFHIEADVSASDMFTKFLKFDHMIMARDTKLPVKEIFREMLIIDILNLLKYED